MFPLNAGTELPTHQGVIVIFRAATGEPIAVMDGRLITEMRTAAVSAVATECLANKDATVLTILGSGVQARAHFQTLGLVPHSSEIRIWSRTTANTQALAKEIRGVATTAEDAVRRADVVVTVTHSSELISRGQWLKPGAFVCAAGAVGTTNRELDDAAMQGCVVVDSREAAKHESGDILLAGARVYAELGEILTGETPVPSASTTVFKSLGLLSRLRTWRPPRSCWN